MINEPPVHLHVGYQHSRFLSTLTRFVDHYSPFWGPKRFTWLLNPKVCLSVGHEQSQYRPILARLLDYYLFLGVPE